MDRLPDSIAERLSPCPNTGCWFWAARWDSGNGYGKLIWEGATWMAHRLIYTILVGPIPYGYVLDHECRTRPCCNPAHLEPATVLKNTLIGDAVLFGNPMDRAGMLEWKYTGVLYG